jgi:putative spermidine/putrescine transport system ATP-binding protein
LELYSKRYPAQLSGGQQQRLAIARTIVLEPSLLLLDEPLSNLDTKLRNEMRVEIKRLHNQLGLTTIYVTHDQSEAMSLSDLVVVMRLGRIEQVGPPQEIYYRPVSLYVADFMGYSNRMVVEIIGREGEQWRVKAPNRAELLALAPKNADLSWKPGEKVLACFKPDEAIVDSPITYNHLQGKVTLVEYMGKAFETLVELEGSPEQQLMVHSYHPVENGATVNFALRSDRLLLFPLESLGTLEVPPARTTQSSQAEAIAVERS